MKRHLLATASAMCLALPVYAQSGDELKDSIDSGIQELTKEGGNVTYSAAEVGDDGGVTLSDFVMKSDDGAATLTAPWVKVTPSTDSPGSVTVTVAPTMTLGIAPPEEPEMAYDLDLNSEGLALVTNWTSALAGHIEGDLTAAMLQVVGTTADHPVMRGLDITQTDVSTHFAFDEATRSINASTEAGSIKGNYGFDMGPEGGTSEASFEGEHFSVSWQALNLPEKGTDPGFDEFIAGGGAVNVNMAAGPMTFTSASHSPELSMSMAGTGGASEASLSIGEAGLAYQASFDGAEYTITPEGAPIPPFTVTMGDGRFDFAMPLVPGDGPEEARFGFEMHELTVSDDLWAMIDPGATIPRDPATLRILLNAALELKQAVGAKPAEGEPPANPMEMAELSNLNVEAVNLSIGGASVDAAGAVAFDNSFGFPMPNGAVDVTLKGIQTLSDSLVALGLVDPMQQAMLMGMISTYGEAGAEPDTYTSTVEFKDGGIFANGKPLQP